MPEQRSPQEDRRAELLALQQEIAEARREVNARLDTLASAVERLLSPPAPDTPPADAVTRASQPAIHAGDEVYVPRLGGTYRVMEVASNGQTFKVQTGAVRVQVRADEIWNIDEPAPEQARRVEPLAPLRPGFNPAIAEIDLHGYSEGHALITLEYFLHHAYAQRVPRVRVIHGKGNGILREAVRRELARNPLVKAIDSGPHFRGEDGVTLADLDL